MNTEPFANACLMDLKKIWDRAPHNAMTDLVRFRNRWFCVFREGENHMSPDGKIRILVSEEGVRWDPAALLEIPNLDLRDPKLSITPTGSLMLNSGAAFQAPENQKHQSFVWFSENGIQWSSPQKVGHPDNWLWRVTWHNNVAYAIGYNTVDPLCVRLYSSNDGVRFNLAVDPLFSEDFPNEATAVFLNDETALCLLRRDAGNATAMLGSSKPPYTEWSWKDLGLRIGGPNMRILPDGRIVAVIRRYGQTPWTSLSILDPIKPALTEFLTLPSGGDTSYAGICWHEEVLWISYYSSHEQKTSIYLAKVKIPQLS